MQELFKPIFLFIILSEANNKISPNGIDAKNTFQLQPNYAPAFKECYLIRKKSDITHLTSDIKIHPTSEIEAKAVAP